MHGITAYAAYVPIHRVDRGEIATTLGQQAAGGARVAAGHDEDPTTMAVEVARQLVSGRQPGSLWLATTRPPYLEKTNAALVHAALGLADDVVAYDAGGAVRSGIGALRGAMALGGMALLADTRVGLPESPEEVSGADGAAGFAFGEDGVLADVLAAEGTTVEVLDRWRFPEAAGVEVWDDRFALDALAGPALAVAERALKRAGLEAADHVIVSSANQRLTAALRGRLGSPGSLVDRQLGFAGTAHAGLLLADLLDRAAANETVLVLAVADGADALVLRTTGLLAESRQAVSVADQLAEGQPVSYAAYLTWRGLLRRQPPRRPDPQAPAAPPSLRESGWKHALVASRCTGCGRVHMPPQRVCSGCGAADQSEAVEMSGRGATVATVTVDRLTYSMSPPVVMAVVDMDGGGRFVVEVTDLGQRQVRIGDRLEPTFRRLVTSEGIHNYFWKMRPARRTDG